MSDHQQGPGWWLASDGRWYAPDQAPAVPPPETWATPPPGPPPRAGMSSGAMLALVVAGVLGALGLLAVIVLVAGSGDDADSVDASAEPADLPDGFTRLEGDGVSIAAPDGWQVLDLEAASMTGEELASAFPGATPEMIEQASGALEQGGVLVAYDFGGDEFVSNTNILEAPSEAPLASIEDEVARQFRSVGADVVGTEIVDVSTGEALRIEYTLPVALDDGSTASTSGVQYYVPVDGRTYIITVSTSQDAGALADVMIDTFRVD